MRDIVRFAIVGALSFWLPALAVHLIARGNFDIPHVWLVTLLSPASFLIAYVVARHAADKRSFGWPCKAMLLGVWIAGNLFILLNATIDGAGFLTTGFGFSMLLVIASVIPISTCMLATYDGSLLALILVTVGALLAWAIRSSGMPFPFLRRSE
jgi:hypothetical protein